MSQFDFDEDTAHKILEWVSNPKGFLVFLGGPGIGKTHFCSSIFAWMFGKWPSMRFWTEKDLFRKLFSSIERNESAQAALQGLVDDHFIIYDDLGSQNNSDWKTSVIFDFVDFRYSAKLPTVITSNLNGREIMDTYGHRVWDRIFDKGNLILEFHDMKSRRQE